MKLDWKIEYGALKAAAGFICDKLPWDKETK